MIVTLTGVNWLLIWPAIYAQNKTEIDSRYKATKDAILRNVDPLLKKIPSNLMNFDTTDLASPATPDEGKKNQ